MTQGLLDKNSLDALHRALDELENGFRSLPDLKSRIELGPIESVLREVADRLQNNFPYFHPLYAGQMLKPPHPVARLAYALSLWINPNNHALDGGRASSAMEKEAVAEIARMFQWERHLGHLCSGGTMANLEALWIARELRPGQTIVASRQAHYTHQRLSGVLGMEFDSVPCDRNGRMDIASLEQRLARGGIGTVVATIGTTATGSVDPLPEILELRQRFDFRLHADAAYGGYFGLTDNLDIETRRSFDRLKEVDSIVIDPHKHGLQPYGCGCVLFRDPSVGQFYRHDSPYTYFTSSELHLGEISLECSRPGAAAVALWATMKMLPLLPNGEFSRQLSACRAAALDFHQRLCADHRFITGIAPELDILVWVVRAASVRDASALAKRIFQAAEQRSLHLALAELPVELFPLEAHQVTMDARTITCLRSVLMKPEHAEWTDELWRKLDEAATEVLRK